jgi:hypothetical protein
VLIAATKIIRTQLTTALGHSWESMYRSRCKAAAKIENIMLIVMKHDAD